MKNIYENIALEYWNNPYGNLSRITGIKMCIPFEIKKYKSFVYRLSHYGLFAYDKQLKVWIPSNNLDLFIKRKIKLGDIKYEK